MGSTFALRWTFAAIFFFVLANGLSLSERKKILPAFGTPPVEEFLVADVSAALVGARRFGADLAFIQFLHYIAQPLADIELQRAGMETGHSHNDGHDHGQGRAAPMSEADIARIADYGLRSVYLDPFFHYSYLFSSGFLAFYLNRYEDALKIIELGIRRDPTYWRFRLYAGAIGYKSRNQTEAAIPLLEEAIRYPDCPTMVANILGNLHEMTGNYARAAEIYGHILATAKDDADLRKARQKLEFLQKKHGV